MKLGTATGSPVGEGPGSAGFEAIMDRGHGAKKHEGDGFRGFESRRSVEIGGRGEANLEELAGGEVVEESGTAGGVVEDSGEGEVAGDGKKDGVEVVRNAVGAEEEVVDETGVCYEAHGGRGILAEGGKSGPSGRRGDGDMRYPVPESGIVEFDMGMSPQ